MILEKGRIRVDISDMCLNMCPCKHSTRINGETIGILDSIEIYKLLKSYNMDIPKHFNYCEKILCNRELNEIISRGEIEILRGKRLNSSKFLETACRFNRYEIVKYMVNECNLDISITSVMESCKHNDIIILKFFKNRGIDLNTFELYNENNQNGYNAITVAAYNNNLNAVRFLLDDCGIKLYTNKISPLYYAINNKCYDVINYLLQVSKDKQIKYTNNEILCATKNKMNNVAIYLIENDLLQNKD
jgi:ankyrin repeat protein